MQMLQVVALVPLFFSVLLVRSEKANETTTAPPHSNSTTSLSKVNATATSQQTPKADITAASSSTIPKNTTPHTDNATSAKPTSGKPVVPSVTTAVPKTMLPSVFVTATPKAAVAQTVSSGFSPGSFIGGIALTLGLLAIGYVGCRTYHSKRGVQYRTIDEHDAII